MSDQPIPHQVAHGSNIAQADRSSVAVVIVGDNNIVNARIPRLPLLRPARAEHFRDRETALTKLIEDLQPGHVVMLCGPGGIGKTALVAEAVWQLAPGTDPPALFPDGIIYHDFYREPQTAIAFEKIARFFDQEPRPTPAAAAQIALAGRQMLLVLDGAEQADDLPALLEVRDRCGVLVTSRKHEETISNWENLTPLPPNDAVSLLQAWGKEQSLDLQSAQDICALVGFLPLAVRLAGSYMNTRGRDAQEYVKWLKKTPLVDWHEGKRQYNSIPILLERSLAQVSHQSRKLMSVIGCLALAPFSPATVAAALDTDSSIQTALDELVNYSLLVRRHYSYEVTHALIHTYARQQLAPPTETVVRLASYFDQEIKTHPDDFPHLHSIRPHVLTLLRIASERGVWETITSLAESIDTYLDLQGFWTDRIQVIESAVAAAKATQNRPDEGAFLGTLGIAYFSLGKVEQAIDYYQQAMTIANETGDRSREGTAISNLGNAHYSLGQIEQAINYYQQALAIAKETGNRESEGITLGNLGNVYRYLGQVDKAIEYIKEALSIAKEVGNHQGEGANLGSLGNAYLSIGQVKQAIDSFQQAITIAKEMGDRRNEGAWLGNLGVIYRNIGQIDQAISTYHQALAIAKEIGDRRNEGIWLGALGIAYDSLGQIEQAIDYHHQALAIAKEISDHKNVGTRLGNLGIAYRKFGQVDQSITYHQQALTIAKQLSDRRNESNQLNNLGDAYADLGQIGQAIQYHQQALALAQKINYRRNEGNSLGGLGDSYYALGQLEQARQFWEQALLVFEEIESPDADRIRSSLLSLQNEQ